MEVESNGMLPFLGIQLLNKAPNIETKVYVKPTNTGLLLHYQSHVDERYKRSLITTMLERGYRISSTWKDFTDECNRLEKLFLKLKYPPQLSTGLLHAVLLNQNEQHKASYRHLMTKNQLELFYRLKTNALLIL